MQPRTGNTQTRREQCPDCGKLGLGRFHYHTEQFANVPSVRERTCRYCGHRQVYDRLRNRHDYGGTWVARGAHES